MVQGISGGQVMIGLEKVKRAKRGMDSHEEIWKGLQSSEHTSYIDEKYRLKWYFNLSEISLYLYYNDVPFADSIINISLTDKILFNTKGIKFIEDVVLSYIDRK